MKRILIFFTVLSMLFLLTACRKELKVTGCKVLHQEDSYVTYQQFCTHCGCEFGDPTTANVVRKLYYSLICTECGELFYVSLERG